MVQMRWLCRNGFLESSYDWNHVELTIMIIVAIFDLNFDDPQQHIMVNVQLFVQSAALGCIQITYHAAQGEERGAACWLQAKLVTLSICWCAAQVLVIG